jgi:hypothetical protein
MRQEVEMLAEQGLVLSEKNRLEMERMLAQEVSLLERQHQLHLATTEYEAKSSAAKDLAALRVKAEKEKEQWAVISNRDAIEADNLRLRTKLDAQQQDLSAGLDHENKMKDLDRTMDYEDKEGELERRRRQRKMEAANEQAEFLRQQENKVAEHNNRLLNGVFKAMDDDEDGA